MDMAAIITKRTPSGTTASCPQGSVRIKRDHSLRINEEHCTAAMALVAKLAAEFCKRHNLVEHIQATWCGEWIGGQTPDGMAFVYASDTNRRSGIERNGFVQNCEGNGKPK